MSFQRILFRIKYARNNLIF